MVTTKQAAKTPSKKAATPTKAATAPTKAATATPTKATPVKEPAPAAGTDKSPTAVVPEEGSVPASIASFEAKAAAAELPAPRLGTGAVEPAGENKAVGAEVKEVVFAWEHAAESVLMAGSFDAWEKKVELSSKGGTHSVSMPLKPGTYSYKFIVDGKWCYDILSPTTTDDGGNVNNVMTV